MDGIDAHFAAGDQRMEGSVNSTTAPQRSSTYRVPERFGLAAILLLTTTIAVVFGGLRYIGAPSSVYMFLGSQIVAICLVQMRFGGLPRGASTLTGMLFLPLWCVLLVDLPRVSAMFRIEIVWILAFLVGFGALLGYITGAVSAGIFLLLDWIEMYFARRAARRENAQSPVSLDPTEMP